MRNPDSDDQVLAQITDVCRWYTGQPPSPQRQASALAELAYLTNGRTELLARHAGSSGRSMTPLQSTERERIVQLCIAAGADTDRIDRWRRDTTRNTQVRDQETWS